MIQQLPGLLIEFGQQAVVDVAKGSLRVFGLIPIQAVQAVSEHGHVVGVVGRQRHGLFQNGAEFIGFSDAIPALANLIAGDGTFQNPDAASDTGIQTVFLGSIRESLDLALKFIFAFGLSFQLPVLLTLLGKAGLVTAAGLGAVRKWAVVGILTLAALVTPPDVVTQLILFTAVYGLYEISILLVRLVERSRIRRMRAEGILDEDEEL